MITALECQIHSLNVSCVNKLDIFYFPSWTVKYRSSRSQIFSFQDVFLLKFAKYFRKIFRLRCLRGLSVRLSQSFTVFSITWQTKETICNFVLIPTEGALQDGLCDWQYWIPLIDVNVFEKKSKAKLNMISTQWLFSSLYLNFSCIWSRK